LLKWDSRSDETISYEDFKKYANKKSLEKHDLILKTIPNFIPNEKDGEYYKIEDFGYKFNEKQELRCIIKGLEDEKFIFVSERHYDALGEAIIKYIQQELMVKGCGLEEVFLDEKTKINNIFLSKDALTNKDKLLILVQGSGPVRAGMWARSLCFNDTLHTGACIDYIKQAQNEGYGIIVLNPNLNGIRREEEAPKVKYNFFDPRKPKKLEKNDLDLIEGSESPPKHVITSYLKYISESKAEHLVFVAHSAGGWATTELLKSKYGKKYNFKNKRNWLY